MNANLYQSTRPPTKTTRPARTVSKTSRVSSVDPLARNTAWFSSSDDKWIDNYTEEWLAFYKAKSAATKSRAECEPLPRVWNNPRE